MRIHATHLGFFFLLIILLGYPSSLLAKTSHSPQPFINVIIVLNDLQHFNKGAEKRNHVSQVAHSMGLKAKHSFAHALFGFSAEIPQARLNALQKDARVKYIEIDKLQQLPVRPRDTGIEVNCTRRPDHHLCQPTPTSTPEPTPTSTPEPTDEPTPEPTPTTPPESTQLIPWGISRIGSTCDSNNCNTGNGVHVFVIDTGIDSNHEDLGTLGTSTSFQTCKGKKNTCLQPWDDDNGHGTHVAGTIAAKDNHVGVIGVAPDVTLHAVKVLDSRGSGYTSNIIAGIDWVASQISEIGAPVVVNMSLGGNGSKTGTCNDIGFSIENGTDTYHEAICNATHQGAIFIVAAGNEGVNANTKRPAAYDDSSIAVSAIGRVVDDAGSFTGELGWPSWSNWGLLAITIGHGHSSFPVAISAPGMGVLSTWKGNKYNTINGTSMAAPHVAGAVALYLSNSTNIGTGYTAFINARNDLLFFEEETNNTNFTIRSGHEHEEGFLNINGF